jgi:membrane fusion protein (multidrug efflux system)
VIEPGPRIDDLWLIDKGLEPGERVAVEGILRLQNGMTVKPVPDTEDAAASEDTGE